VDGLRIRVATGKLEYVALTASELQAATDRRQAALAKEREEQERQQQRQVDLELLKTAEIGVLREILARLL